MPGHAEPTIYDAARMAGVAPSTVSRASSKPGRVSYKTADHVRRVAEQLGYRTGRMECVVSERGIGMLGMIVADIANPVFFGMIRGAERAASDRGFSMLMVETQESEEVERAALDRLIPVVDDVILSASRRLGDSLGRQAQTTGAAQPDGQRGVIGGE
jgi:DNA-binding LacI/PurR family transcriptional regulator